MNSFWQMSIGDVISAIAVIMASPLVFKLYKERQEPPTLKAKVLDQKNFDIKNFRLETNGKFPDVYDKLYDDNELRKYFKNKEVDIYKNGFWLDYFYDVAVLFMTTSSTEKRSLGKKATITKLTFENIQVKIFKIEHITVIWNENAGSKTTYYTNRTSDVTKKDIDACFGDIESTIYLVVLEVFDKENKKSWLCDHEQNSDKVFYETMIARIILTSHDDKKHHFDVRVKMEGGKFRTDVTKV